VPRLRRPAIVLIRSSYKGRRDKKHAACLGLGAEPDGPRSLERHPGFARRIDRAADQTRRGRKAAREFKLLACQCNARDPSQLVGGNVALTTCQWLATAAVATGPSQIIDSCTEMRLGPGAAHLTMNLRLSRAQLEPPPAGTLDPVLLKLGALFSS
jgi:hypothetical protein